VDGKTIMLPTTRREAKSKEKFMSLEELEKRVKVLEDIDQIKKLQGHYVNCLTTASWPEVRACFSDNAVIDFPQGCRDSWR
jgi:hypothetical protein